MRGTKSFLYCIRTIFCPVFAPNTPHRLIIQCFEYSHGGLRMCQLRLPLHALQASGRLFGWLHPFHCNRKRIYHRLFVFPFVLFDFYSRFLLFSTSRALLNNVFMLSCDSSINLIKQLTCCSTTGHSLSGWLSVFEQRSLGRLLVASAAAASTLPPRSTQQRPTLPSLALQYLQRPDQTGERFGCMPVLLKRAH